VPLDLEQIRERWFENYFRYRYGAAVILDDDKPCFEVQVLSREQKAEKPITLSQTSMGAPLSFPKFTPAGCKTLSQSVERLAEKYRDTRANVSVLGEEIDKLVYSLYALTPDEIKIVEGN
jgi:hypothetical protein